MADLYGVVPRPTGKLDLNVTAANAEVLRQRYKDHPDYLLRTLTSNALPLLLDRCSHLEAEVERLREEHRRLRCGSALRFSMKARRTMSSDPSGSRTGERDGSFREFRDEQVGYRRGPGFLRDIAGDIAGVCLRCGALVLDKDRHDRWHRRWFRRG